jgi:ferredoxin-NADP reductase
LSSDTGATDTRAPGRWRTAVLSTKRRETPTAVTVAFTIDGWPGHLAGQHVDIRLTADDGYQAQRSYSIASAPDADALELTIERIEDGEVSPYLVDVMEPGDELELRGPVGGWFVWRVEDGGPLLLVAGGSGLVPLMAMLRHRARSESAVPVRLLVSARSLEDLIYAAEIDRLAGNDEGLEVFTTLTRSAPADWQGYRRRIDQEMLREVAWAPEDLPRTFVCGPTAFVEAAANGLVALGHDQALIKTERFGPTGG